MNSLLQIKNIRKTFPGVVALDEISLSIAPGEIHTLLGENGAGKSTLMNVLTGLYRPDRGEIFFDGKPVTFSSPRESLAMGIGMLPTIPLERVKVVGNAAGTGARMMLISQQARAEAERLSEKIQYLELTVYPEFPIFYANGIRA